MKCLPITNWIMSFWRKKKKGRHETDQVIKVTITISRISPQQAPADVRHLRLALYQFYGISANNEWLKFDWKLSRSYKKKGTGNSYTLKKTGMTCQINATHDLGLDLEPESKKKHCLHRYKLKTVQEMRIRSVNLMVVLHQG